MYIEKAAPAPRRKTVRASVPVGAALPTVGEWMQRVGMRLAMKTADGNRWVIIHGVKLTGGVAAVSRYNGRGFHTLEIEYEDLGPAPASITNGAQMLGGGS